MLEQEQATRPSATLQRLVQEVQARRLLMRERVRQLAGAEPVDNGLRPVCLFGPLYRLFSDLRG